MMLSAARSSLLALLAPLPLVVTLAAYELNPILSFASRDAFFALAAVGFSAAYLAAVWRVRRPQYSVGRGAPAWFLVAGCGFGVYLLGSFVGGAVLHWEGVLVIYLGLVAYLAGKRFASALSPGVISIALLPLPLVAGSLLADALAVALLASAVISVIVLASAKRVAQVGCGECESYSKKGEQFCGFCGRTLYSPVRFGVPGWRLAATWVTSAFLIALLVGTMVPLASLSTTGLLVIDHRLGGVSGVTALPTYPGWTSTLTGSEGNLTLTTYNYTLGGRANVNASLALSTSDGVGALSLIGSHPGASENGTASLATGETAVFYTWTAGGAGYTGVLLASHVTYLSSGHVVQSYAAFLFSQPSATAGKSRTALLSLAGDTSSAFQLAKEGGPVLSAVVGPITSNYDYALMAASAVFLGAIGGVARNSDADAARRSDNAFSLAPAEFDALASLGGGKFRWTGRELEGAMNLHGGWGTLSQLLDRLVSLGLMEKEVGVVDGSPRLFWANRSSP